MVLGALGGTLTDTHAAAQEQTPATIKETSQSVLAQQESVTISLSTTSVTSETANPTSATATESQLTSITPRSLFQWSYVGLGDAGESHSDFDGTTGLDFSTNDVVLTPGGSNGIASSVQLYFQIGDSNTYYGPMAEYTGNICSGVPITMNIDWDKVWEEFILAHPEAKGQEVHPQLIYTNPEYTIHSEHVDADLTPYIPVVSESESTEESQSDSTTESLTDSQSESAKESDTDPGSQSE